MGYRSGDRFRSRGVDHAHELLEAKVSIDLGFRYRLVRAVVN